MVPPHGRDRPEIEEELRREVEQATTDLKRANAERARLLSISDDVTSGPDGAVAVQQAMRLQRRAVRRLREALREFEAFTNPHH